MKSNRTFFLTAGFSRSCVLSFLLILGSVCPSWSGVLAVWAVNDGEKIFRYDTSLPAKQKNSIWDGQRIHLRGLYNEVLGFQIIVELDSTGASALEISMAPPIHKSTSSVIGGSGSIPYGDDGYIECFTQHYLHVTRPTKPNWFYGSEKSAPPHMTGWIPDALIPSNAKPGQGGFPVYVPPTRKEEWRMQNELKITPRASAQNQGFWIDLYLPRNRALPAGVYTSAVSVLLNGETVASLPVGIELLPEFLPDENHSNVWVFNSSPDELQRFYPDLSTGEIRNMVKFEAHRHRIDLAGGFRVHQSAFDESLLDEYLPYLNGRAFTPGNGYHGPGQGKGEHIFPIGMYGSPVLGETKETIQIESDKWVHWFQENVPGVTFFWYIIDEPGPVQFPWILERTGWLKSNPGPGSQLPVHLTREYTEELKDAIDIWDAYDGVELDKLAALQKSGKDYWFYNGNRPRYGSFILEGTAVDMRVNGWIKFLFGIDTWFIWQSTHWKHNSQGPKGRLYQRVYNEPLTFINWHMEWGNGDGILFYPGHMPMQPEEDRGLNRILPSIRLKNIRRGQQDYELLWLATQKAGKEKIDELIRKVVPKAMSETDMKAPVAWSQKGNDYDEIRDELLNIIVE